MEIGAVPASDKLLFLCPILPEGPRKLSMFNMVCGWPWGLFGRLVEGPHHNVSDPETSLIPVSRFCTWDLWTIVNYMVCLYIYR